MGSMSYVMQVGKGPPDKDARTIISILTIEL